METRWLRHLGPPVVALAVLGTVVSASPGPAEGANALPNCRIGDRPASIVDGSPGWYRLTPELDGNGALAVRRLDLGTLAGPAWRLDLPPESFASGPVGGRVLVGADDGRRSSLRIVDAETGCWTDLGRAADVIRSAVLDPTADAIYEHRVDRATRADLGIWRRSLADDAVERVLAPLPVDPDVGLVWATPLFWSAEADRVIVASCGEVACRLRWVERSGAVGTVPGAAFGEPIGVVRGEAIVHEPCAARPCAVVAVGLDDGRVRRIDDSVVAAALVPGPGGFRLALERANGHVIRLLDPTDLSGASVDLPGGSSLLAPPWRSDAAVESTAGTPIVRDDDRPGPALNVLLSPLPTGENDR